MSGYLRYFTSWMYGLWASIKDYLFGVRLANGSFHNIKKIEDLLERDDNYKEFDESDERFGKTIYALNNIPNKIHELLFGNIKDVSNNYYNIPIKKIDGKYKVASFDTAQFGLDMEDDSIRYVYIRINIIKKSGKRIMNHVNCIIIDKRRHFLLYFEPTVLIRYDLTELKEILTDVAPILFNYAFLVPESIGYNVFNRLQKYNHYCQTYVLYVYCLVLENREIEPDEFSRLFNDIITTKNIHYFIYFINKMLEDDGVNLNNFCVDYKYSNGLKVLIKNDNDELLKIEKIQLEEDSDTDWLVG